MGLSIAITLPEFNFDINVEGWKNVQEHNNASVWQKCVESLSSIEDKAGGVYFLEGAEGVLYIGRSVNLKERLVGHLVGNDRKSKTYKEHIAKVSGFYEDDIANQEIYEAYAIKTITPLHNKAKTTKVYGNYGRYPSKQ